MEKLFYVYEHWRPDINVCFYVGKGHGRRAHDHSGRNWYHARITNKLARLGMRMEVRMIGGGLSEQEAFDLERARIKFWRDVDVVLTNISDGGEGPSGYKHSLEFCEKQRVARIGKSLSAETRLRISIAHIGKIQAPHTKEHKAKIAAKSRGRLHTVETRAKISEAASNRSPETRAKLSSALTGRTLTPEHIAKLKAAVRPPHTEEHRANMRKGQARRAPRTEEHKARIAAAITAWHAQRNSRKE